MDLLCENDDGLLEFRQRCFKAIGEETDKIMREDVEVKASYKEGSCKISWDDGCGPCELEIFTAKGKDDDRVVLSMDNWDREFDTHGSSQAYLPESVALLLWLELADLFDLGGVDLYGEDYD